MILTSIVAERLCMQCDVISMVSDTKKMNNKVCCLVLIFEFS